MSPPPRLLAPPKVKIPTTILPAEGQMWRPPYLQSLQRFIDNMPFLLKTLKIRIWIMGHDILVIDCFFFFWKKANLDLIFTEVKNDLNFRAQYTLFTLAIFWCQCVGSLNWSYCSVRTQCVRRIKIAKSKR